MQFLEEEIIEITETTWQAMLGLDIHSKPGEAIPQEAEGLLTGRVEIHGAWDGVVLLHGSIDMARSAASIFFSLEASVVTEEDQIDAMYELSNIIAGNIKSLLPEPCQLSLPTVLKPECEKMAEDGATRLSAFTFDCQGQSVLVTVWKFDESR